jgi:hypothetical protein
MSDEKVLAAIATLQGSISALREEHRQSVGALRDEQLGSINTLRTDMGAAMTALRQDVTGEITTLRVAVMDRYDRMEARFTEMSDDMTVNMASVDVVHKSNDNIRGEMNAIHEQLAVLTRKQRRLEAQVHDLTKPPGLACAGAARSSTSALRGSRAAN